MQEKIFHGTEILGNLVFSFKAINYHYDDKYMHELF